VTKTFRSRRWKQKLQDMSDLSRWRMKYCRSSPPETSSRIFCAILGWSRPDNEVTASGPASMTVSKWYSWAAAVGSCTYNLQQTVIRYIFTDWWLPGLSLLPHSQSLSTHHQIPRLFQAFLTKALTFIKPPQVYTDRPICTRGTRDIFMALSIAQLYLTVLRLCLLCDYHNCDSTPQPNHNLPDFS